MTDEQKTAALAWLDRAYTVEDDKRFGTAFSDPHRAVIKAMLADPRLPPDPIPEMERIMWKAGDAVQSTPGWDPGRGRMRAAYHALRAHLAAR